MEKITKEQKCNMILELLQLFEDNTVVLNDEPTRIYLPAITDKNRDILIDELILEIPKLYNNDPGEKFRFILTVMNLTYQYIVDEKPQRIGNKHIIVGKQRDILTDEIVKVIKLIS